jgi:hypothetical protein
LTISPISPILVLVVLPITLIVTAISEDEFRSKQFPVARQAQF